MKTHKLTQGSPEWHAHRAKYRNASDAPAMMGCSPYKTRSQLIHEMATGIMPDVAPAQQRRFDDGHRYEALARPLAEEFIGQELFPVVGTEGNLSASFDGLTMAEDIGFEHKTLNDDLRAVMVEGATGADLPLVYRVQLEQQCMVSKRTQRILFMASKWAGEDLVEERHCFYEPDAALAAEIAAGWAQFDIDLAEYVPTEATVAPVAAPATNLPALSIQVNGSIALVDNLQVFGAALEEFVGNINQKPATDQDFADLEGVVKTLKKAEEALTAAENNALAQTESIEVMRRTVGQYRELARTNRLLAERIVKVEKDNRKAALVQGGKDDFAKHMEGLNARLGKPYMPQVPTDFAEAIKGLKTITSIQNAIKQELARGKIESNAIADRIQTNLNTLRELASEHAFLFSDTPQLVLKANDDLTVLVKSRIGEHQAEQKRKEDEARERIRAEEQAKAEAAAREKLAAEQAEAARVERERQEAEARAVQKTQAAAAPVESAQAATETVAQTLTPQAAWPMPSPASPTVTLGDVVRVMMPASVRQAMAPKADTPPSLRIGEIANRLGFGITAAFLRTVGFEPAGKEGASVLFHESDFPMICAALIAHISEVQDQFEAVAA